MSLKKRYEFFLFFFLVEYVFMETFSFKRVLFLRNNNESSSKLNNFDFGHDLNVILFLLKKVHLKKVKVNLNVFFIFASYLHFLLTGIDR